MKVNLSEIDVLMNQSTGFTKNHCGSDDASDYSLKLDVKYCKENEMPNDVEAMFSPTENVF